MNVFLNCWFIRNNLRLGRLCMFMLLLYLNYLLKKMFKVYICLMFVDS